MATRPPITIAPVALRSVAESHARFAGRFRIGGSDMFSGIELGTPNETQSIINHMKKLFVPLLVGLSAVMLLTGCIGVQLGGGTTNRTQAPTVGRNLTHAPKKQCTCPEPSRKGSSPRVEPRLGTTPRLARRGRKSRCVCRIAPSPTRQETFCLEKIGFGRTKEVFFENGGNFVSATTQLNVREPGVNPGRLRHCYGYNSQCHCPRGGKAGRRLDAEVRIPV
jgi:hypothetical protein